VAQAWDQASVTPWLKNLWLKLPARLTVRYLLKSQPLAATAPICFPWDSSSPMARLRTTTSCVP
jgi:hypothetical protein